MESLNLVFYEINKVISPFYILFYISVGLLSGLAVYLIVDSIYPKPPTSIMSLTRFVGSVRNTSLSTSSKDNFKYSEEKVNQLYLRLRSSKTFKNYVSRINVLKFNCFLIGFTGISAGIFMVFIGLMLEPTLAIIGVVLLVLSLALLLGKSYIANYFANNEIESAIKSLNYYQRIELPYLIERFKSVSETYTTNTVTSVISNYLEISSALSSDLELFLTDINVYTTQEALRNWAERVLIVNDINNTDYLYFIDKIKKMYIVGDTKHIFLELKLLSNNIDEQYVAPYIDRYYQNIANKMSKIMLYSCMLFVISVIVPFFVRMAGDLSGLGDLGGLGF